MLLFVIEQVELYTTLGQRVFEIAPNARIEDLDLMNF